MNKYKTYHIYKETKAHTTGCPEDESESTTYNSIIMLVPEDETEAYNEMLADEYGNQDYSYQFTHKKICTLSGAELNQLKKAIERETKEEEKRKNE